MTKKVKVISEGIFYSFLDMHMNAKKKKAEVCVVGQIFIGKSRVKSGLERTNPKW